MRRRGVFVVMGGAVCAACLVARPVRAGGHRGDDLDAAHVVWRGLAGEARRLPLVERIAFVNTEINRRTVYQADADDGGDHWATPCETLARGRGDCEDFAIAKHFLLEACGVPTALHRLLYARLQPQGGRAPMQPHLAAVARDPRFDDPWVLDQANPVLLALSLRDDLEPLFSFDARAIWQRVDATPLPRAPLRAARWLSVLERTRLQRH
jgi:predicted transglutaminase-like cysteine proteinase